jgi:hypothetical protein
MSKQYQKTVFENVEAKLTKKVNQLFGSLETNMAIRVFTSY